MDVRSGISADTPGRIVIDAGAIYLNYGLTNQRLLGATRGGNEFTPGRVSRQMEVDGPKGRVKGMDRIIEVNPQITANLIELSVENLIAAIAGANQGDRGYIESEYAGVGDGGVAEFDLLHNDVIPNSERVYVSGATGLLTLQTRSKKYDSQFVGANAADNKEFEGGVGSWDSPESGDVHEIDVNGQLGNCLKFIAGATSAALFMKLLGADGAVITGLVHGTHYRFQFAMKKGATWSVGGVVTVAVNNGSKAVTLDTAWEVYVIEFTASGTSADITFTGAGTPGSGEICYIDHLELEKVDTPAGGVQLGYVMNWNDNKQGFGSVILATVPDANNKIIVSYSYLLAAPGTHTTITGGDIADADYITNVAIVGNVSGKTNPIICIIDNVLADAGFSLALAPRDEAVPVIVFTGHYLPDDLDTEPWRVRWPNS